MNVDDVELTQLTGAYDIVRKTISSTLNSWLGKQYLKSSIESTGEDYIKNKINPGENLLLYDARV